ncbi:MAG TPA: DegT/DnrJ/EryC1/StrS family aminotransferase [Armatimonadota bacterium]|nr:DegT/DnrJ/EryC1/StrS family aminotransferase [Armatimonadota bacterium]
MAVAVAPVHFPVFAPTLPDPAELHDVIVSVFASGRVTVGPQVAALEEEVGARLGVRHVIGVSCGTNALLLLLRALNLPAGGEVITPTFTFAATAQALLWHGLTPVFCDSDPDTFTMDAAAADALITEKTVAIYPVNIFGVAGDLDAYQALADRHGLPLLFDSAQGIGSTYKGRAVGTFGAGEAFSMSPTKVVTALEGGLITTNDDELAYQLRYMRDYGKAEDGEDMRWLGLSARMSEINAAVARWSFARLDTWIANRTAIMERYLARLGEMPGLSTQQIPADRTSSRNYIVILLDPDRAPITRDELYRKLKDEGVQTKRYFYPALHNQTLFRDVEPGCAARLPVAARIADTALALPMYSHMTLDTVDEICDIVESCCMAYA